jgi:hypothetical protein
MFLNLPPLEGLRCDSLRMLLRRSVAAAMLAAYVVVAAGVPLPSASRPAKSGERYPCESCGCGCDSAEHCWRNCCCHTLAERLAWAEQNGVTPPAFALAEARQAGLDDAGRPHSTKVVRVAVATKSPTATPSCCHSKASCCSSHSKHTPQDDASLFVVAWRALACHGQSLNWLAAVPSLISVELNLSDQLPLVTWLGPHSSEVAAGVADVPTPPPPERA